MQVALRLMQVSPHLHPNHPQPSAASTTVSVEQAKNARVKVLLIFVELHITAIGEWANLLLVDPTIGN